MTKTPFKSVRFSSPNRIAALAGSLLIVLAAIGSFLISQSATTISSAMRWARSVPVVGSAVPLQSQSNTFYLHGTGPTDNPPTLLLDTIAPTATTAKFKDSSGVSRSGGNPWNEVGTWNATSAMTPGTLTSLSDLHFWLGLKNSDDQGTYFDVRAEAYNNNTLVGSGQSLCITGVTRNAANAKEVVVAFDPFSPLTFNGTSDVLKLKILTRVGTNQDGSSCGGHSSAIGLRLYFDAVTRASRFNATTQQSSDTTPPVLTIEQPPDNSITSAAQVSVSGTFSGQSPTTITVNSIAAIINGQSFSATVPLVEGTNTLTVVATDAHANRTELSRTVIRDTTAPTLAISSPSNDAVLRQVAIVGTATDALPVSVTANGIPLVFDNEETFSTELELSEGPQQVHIMAIDAAGNQSEETRNVRVDLTAPVISEVTPVNGALGDSPVAVQGRITDASVVTVTVNGSAASVGSDSRFIAQVPVDEAGTLITIIATDAAGNETTSNLTVGLQDRTAPTGPTLFPVITPTRLSFQTIEGRAEPGSVINVAGGVEAATANAASGTGLFTATVKLITGANTLSLTATDSAGNVSPATQVSITSDPAMALPPAGQASQINISTGNAQKGLPNTELPRPLIAIVSDKTGAPVANALVRFTVAQGGGQFIDGSTTVDVATDAQGHASSRYKSGSAPGPQLIRADFTGDTLTPAIFMAEVLEATATDTVVSGVVLDQNLRALPNVLVRLGGQQTRSGSNGRFSLTNVAAGPHQVLELIGRDQITLPGRWPNISYDFDVLPGVDNNLGRPLFLPKVNDGINVPLGTGNVVTEDTTFELPVVGGDPPIKVTARAGTHITFPPDVTDKRLSVTRIATNRVPMVLEDGRATNLYISVQPSGAVFDQPLEISFPNLDHLAAGTAVLLMSFDHDAGRYVRVGDGHVSADGRTVTSDPGSGIRVGAWHALPPEPPQPEVTVLGHIQVLDNAAFENKVLEKAEAWVEGTRAVALFSDPPPSGGGLSEMVRLDYRATLTLPSETPVPAKMEALAQTTDPTVSSLAWEQINSALDTNPNAGGGMRIYPDRLALNVQTNQKIVKVKAEITPKAAGVFVYFRSFDVDDPSTDDSDVDANGPAGGDNRGTPKAGTLKAPVFAADAAGVVKAKTDANGVASVTFTVTSNPGDNFKVVASCKSGYVNTLVVDGTDIKESAGGPPPTQGQTTEMLTVWRRVHIEADSMDAVPTTGPQRNVVAGVIDKIVGAGTTATSVYVDQNLDDGSPMLGKPGPCVSTDPRMLCNGRFDKGTIRIGATGSVAVTDTLDGNGDFYLQKDAAKGGISIPFKITKTGETDVTGNVVARLVNNVTINVTSGTLTTNFVNGSISVAGVAMSVTAVNVAQNAVTVSAWGSVPFELVDDDGATMPVEPDISLLESKYRAAYIFPISDEGGTKGNNKKNVPFKAKFDSPTDSFDSLTATNGLESDKDRADDFWILYFQSAYQGRPFEPTNQRGDGDPDGELPNSTGGNAPAIQGQSSKGSYAFVEVRRDWDRLGFAGSLALTNTHESAHQFGLHDCYPTASDPTRKCTDPLDLMGQGLYDPGARFSMKDLNNLRNRVKSPGK